MLERDDGTYANTPATDLFLDRAKPSYVGGLLEMANARLYGFWGSLTEGLRTGEPQNEAKTGGDFFAALYADPARLAQFAKAMSSASMPARRRRSRRSSRGRDHQTVIDIGCAEGTLPVQSRSPTSTSPAAASTCPRSSRSSRTTSRPLRAHRPAALLRPATSSPTRCRAPTCS